MERRRTNAATFLGVVALTLVGWVVVTAGLTARATWTSENCFGSSSDRTTWKRADAYAYAQPARSEGYEWNGGCYKLNNRDDTEGWPVDADGEGADCSGFVFKVWALRKDGSAGYRFWDHEMDVHGPYSTWQYIEPASADQFHSIAKTYSATEYMDAFVYRRADEGHIALIQSEGSDGSDYVIHARNNTLGTLVNYLDYRSYSDSEGLTREGWTPPCYPRCSGPTR
jgi:hypothetical protein